MTAIRNALIGTALVVLASSSAALAQGTPEQRSACMGDAFRLCSSEIPSVERVTACLKANYSKVSAGCKAAAAKGASKS
jgi:hypothetical protein